MSLRLLYVCIARLTRLHLEGVLDMTAPCPRYVCVYVAGYNMLNSFGRFEFLQSCEGSLVVPTVISEDGAVCMLWSAAAANAGGHICGKIYSITGGHARRGKLGID